MPEATDLGILVVHGIGSQRRGDTLLGLAEPLTQSLTDWFGADAVACIAPLASNVHRRFPVAGSRAYTAPHRRSPCS